MRHPLVVAKKRQCYVIQLDFEPLFLNFTFRYRSVCHKKKMQKTPIFLVNMKNLHSKFFLKTALRVVERKEEMVLACSNFGMKDIQIKFVSRPKQFQMFSRSIRSGSTTFSRNFFPKQCFCWRPRCHVNSPQLRSTLYDIRLLLSSAFLC